MDTEYQLQSALGHLLAALELLQIAGADLTAARIDDAVHCLKLECREGLRLMGDELSLNLLDRTALSSVNT